MQTHNIEKSKTPVPRKPILAVALALAAAFIAKYSIADTYILGGESNENNVGSSSSPVSWSDVAQWTPAAVPSGADEVNWAPSKTGSHRHAYVALSNDYAIGSLTTKYRTLHLYRISEADKNPVTFTVNGQLGGDDYQQLHEVNSGVRLVLPSGATMVCSKGGHTHTGLSVLSGGEAEIFGAVQSRVMTLSVANGGALVFSPSSYTISSWGRSDNDHDEINVAGGTISFPNGITMTGSASTPNNQLNQSGGTAVFGGGFASELPWDYTWSGGSLNVVSNSAFGANVALIVPASSSVALDVASGKTFSVANFTADSTATITKSGAGIFAYAPTAAAIAVNEGGIGFASASEYALINVTFGSGTVIALNTLGATISAISATTGNAKFVADLSGATAGTAVLNSANSAVLEKAKADLEEASAVPAGFGLQISNGVLSLEVQSEYSFVGTGSTTNILDVAGWGGSLPPNGADVAIDGEGVVATLQNGDSFPAWNSIEVKNGATLRIESSTSLIPIELNKSASLEIASGVTVSLSSASDLSGIAVASQVPVLSIESGATLNVPGGMKFSNVDIDLKGEIAATSGGGVTFGYAELGNTTFIGLKVDGGVVSLLSSTTNTQYDTEPLEFCCPAPGGAVVAIDSLTFTNATIKPWARTSYRFTEQCEFGFHMGINNPEANLFTVVFDDTAWGVSGKTIIKGGATFRLQNGGRYQNAEAKELWNRTAEISQSGKVVVANGGLFRLNSMGEWGNKALDISPTSANHRAIVVEEGGEFESYSYSGNGKGILDVIGSGNYRVYVPGIYHVGSSKTYDTTNIPFAGLASVNITENSTLMFTTRNRLWSDGMFTDDSGERVVALADVPIKGGGSIALDNANANVFGVIVKSGANEATGTASVVAPTGSEGPTTLYFANGANWAGTVVADGNVAMTNLVDAAASVTNTFGTLRLDADFPVRVWKSGGKVVANDYLVVDTFDGTGSITLVEGDEPLSGGDSFELGKIKAGGNLPKVVGRWNLSLGPADDDGYCAITAKCVQGMMLIFL